MPKLVPVAASWPKLREVCQQATGLYPAYGLHPMFLDQHRPEHLPQLRAWIEQERPCAIGECGLDFFVEGLDAEAQQDYFLGQLKLAREFDLPVIVHARRAVDAVIAAIRRIGGLRGVVHSFSGSPEQAAQLHKLGFLLGLGGPLTYERAQRLQRLVREMPLQQLLLETDAPDIPPHWLYATAAQRLEGLPQGRNAPGELPRIASALAELRSQPLEDLAGITCANALVALPRLQALVSV